MWIKINNQVINSTLIRHISGIQEASPERFHADKMDEWVFLEMLEMGSAEVMKWRYMLNLVGLALGVETRTEPKNSFTDARWRVIRRTAVPGEAVKEEFVDDWKPFYFFTVKLRQPDGKATLLLSISSRGYATYDEASAARDALATMLNELEAALPLIEI
jgi:hypothetical protein